jgi:hypothetical protein
MNHNEVVRQKLTERYLLRELDGEALDEFEEHFFECSECALDVRAGSQFVENSKIILSQPAERPVLASKAPRKPTSLGWFGWLRPGFAAAALALLIAVVGYQNLITLPRLQGTLHQPQTLPWAAVAVGTYGSSGPSIQVQEGKGFLLFVRIPPDGTYSRYIADLYNPAGGLECSLTIPATSIKDQWPVLVPGANRKEGNYRISVRGVTPSGEIKDLGSAPFTLQTQN